MQGHPRSMGCALQAVAFLLLLTPISSTKFVANPVDRLSDQHRKLIEQLWKVRDGRGRMLWWHQKAAPLQYGTHSPSETVTWSTAAHDGCSVLQVMCESKAIYNLVYSAALAQRYNNYEFALALETTASDSSCDTQLLLLRWLSCSRNLYCQNMSSGRDRNTKLRAEAGHGLPTRLQLAAPTSRLWLLEAACQLAIA